jgi:cytidine deaminase
MKKSSYQFEFEEFDTIDELTPSDQSLLLAAREVTKLAYAPYSEFLVGAAALLKNGEVVKGTNQENASYSVGICAERTLLASAAMLYPNIGIQTMAIAYHNLNGSSNEPVSPCGICRQSINEFEGRTKQPIRLILSGMEGKIMIIEKASMLLPMSFGSDNLLQDVKK